MNKPGHKDCKVLNGGIWLSRDILETMRDIYAEKEMFAEIKPRSYYCGKREVFDDLIRFLSGS